MKQYIYIIFIFFTLQSIYAQVGINTDDPQAMLDVQASSPGSPIATDGFLPPRVSVLPTGMTAAQTGMMVYLTTPLNVNTPAGIYIYNGSSFQNIATLANINKTYITGTLSTSFAVGGGGAGSYATIPFNIETNDTFNEYDITTFTFTANQTGTYRIYAQGYQNEFGGTPTHSMRIRRNGSITVAEDTRVHSSGTLLRVISTFVTLSAGDTITFEFNREFATLEVNSSYFLIEQI